MYFLSAVQRMPEESEANSQREQCRISTSHGTQQNIQISLATELQDVSATFRKSQSLYLAKLWVREPRSKDLCNMPSVEDQPGEEDDSVFCKINLLRAPSSMRFGVALEIVLTTGRFNN
ncbi:hypothetical protein BJ742DRAFT_809462 [Cladochytrium replicatum]|nr:hypothetical protein BJ742DRAFT_809462 [Cladochytrium replicatum]